MADASSQPRFTTIVTELEHAFLRDAQETRYEDLLSAHATMELVLIQVRRRLNGFIPVGALPPELLSRVFALSTQLLEYDAVYHLRDTAGKAAPLVTSGSSRLLSLTHVCSHWRLVALNTPVLWTHVDDRHPEQTEMFISRSQPMALSVVVDATRLNTGTLEHYGSRLRRLDIIISDSITSPGPLLRLALNQPALDCLTINSKCRTLRDRLETSPRAFGQSASHLKALALCLVPLWHTGIQFSDLTHLYLDWGEDSAWPSESEPVRHLSSLLSHTPALQYLHLVHLDDSEPVSDVTVSPSPIPLNSIRAVTCTRSNMSTAFHLLSLLKLPETAFVRLDKLERTVPLEAALAPRTGSPLLVSSLRNAQFVIDGDNIFLLAEGPESGLWIRGSIFSDDLEGRDPSWRSYITAPDRLDILPSIQTLRLKIEDNEHAILALLRRMRAVEHLTVIIEGEHSRSIRANARAIYAALSDPEACPCLRSLVILCGFKNWKDLCRLKLVPKLQARALQGRPLGRLAVKQWWTPTTDPQAARDEHESWGEALRGVFPAARQYVEVVEIAEGDDILPFAPRDAWRVDGAEDYWDILPEDQPKYDPPPQWPSAREN